MGTQTKGKQLEVTCRLVPTGITESFLVPARGDTGI